MNEAGELTLDFADYGYLFFRRDKPNFPVSGRLLGNPACWKDDDRTGLEAEFAKAISIVPSNSPLLPSLGLMLNYSTSEDRTDFLKNTAESGSLNSAQLRFAAYQSLSLGEFDQAASLFERIDVWDLREFLAAAIANIELDQWRTAERIVDSLTKITWPYITKSDTVLMYRVLETIRTNDTLTAVPENYVDDLREQVEKMGQSTADLELDYSLLCAD
jgi:hypothetical protein